MRMLLDRLQGLFGLFLLAAMLIGWSGASESGGFIGANSTVTVDVSADKTTLPVNLAGESPNPNRPYTTTITVRVKKNGNQFPTTITISEVPTATGIA